MSGKVLELGGGKDPATNGINVDIEHVDGVDILADITTPWPFATSAFDRIEAHHVLEHIAHSDVETVFEEVSRTLRPGGRFYAVVPLAHSRSAVNDPTHESHWYWRTPAYYCDDELAYQVGQSGELKLIDRGVTLFLTSGKWFARPFSFALKHTSKRWESLIELVKLPWVTGYLDFTMQQWGGNVA